MPTFRVNGEDMGGCANSAASVLAYDKDGNKTTVQKLFDAMEEGGGGNANVHILTQAEYDALPDSKNSDGVIYVISDAPDMDARNIFYDGSKTGLGNDIQEAIDNLSKRGGLVHVKLTQAAYDALGTEKNTNNVIYTITDSDAELTAKNIECVGADGKTSNVQSVLDEQNNKIGDFQAELDKITAIDLLWENASPTSTFENGQTLVFDRTKYKFLLIEAHISTNYTETISTLIKNEVGITYRLSYFGSTPFYRGVTVKSNGLGIGTGNKQTAIGTTTGDNNGIIPVRIYGVY